MKNVLHGLCLMLLSLPLPAQILKGSLLDAATGQPLAYAAVSLPNTPLGTATTQDGTFQIKGIKPGTYSLRVTLLGYTAHEQTITIAPDATTEVAIQLTPVIIELNRGAIVSAQRYETEAFTRPEAISVVTERELRQRTPRSVPEALFGTPGVFLQKTNHGGGSPFIRGLTGQQTLLMIDGIRLNNATFRSGPNQYFNTIDPQSVERIEVVRGSGSVQYGSDALGGVAQVLTKTPQFTDQFRVGGTGFLKYMTSDMEKSGRAEVNVSNAHFALLGGLAYRDFGDIKAGGDLGFLRPSGYTQLSGDVKARFRLSNNYLFTAAYQQVDQNDVPLYHRVQLENFQYYRFEPQQRQLGYVRAEAFYTNKWLQHVQLTGSFQRFREGRQSRKNESSTRTQEQDDVRTWGAVLSVNSAPTENWQVQSGAELYHDQIGSSRTDINTGTNLLTAKRGLYPDGSTSTSFALYTLHTYTRKALTLTAGGRFNTYNISVKEVVLGTSVIQPSAWVGNAGASYAVHSNHRVIASINTAFRAPNIDDMGTLGIVDFRYEVPNTDLQPEKSLNFELGWKAKTDWLSATVVGYHNRLTNIIGRIRSAGDSTQGYPVYLKENVAGAYIQGLEAEAEIQLSRSLSTYGSLIYTYGQNKTVNEPFRRIPPLNGRVGLYYQHPQKVWGRVESIFASQQDRLAQGDKDDNRIGSGGTPGWWLANVSTGYTYRWLSLSAEFHNLFNEAYKTHGSGVYGIGRSVWFAARVEF